MSKVKPTVLMGFFDTQKGYVLYDIRNDSFSINRDVSFRQDVFPFKEGNKSTQKSYYVFPIDDQQCILANRHLNSCLVQCIYSSQDVVINSTSQHAMKGSQGIVQHEQTQWLKMIFKVRENQPEEKTTNMDD